MEATYIKWENSETSDPHNCLILQIKKIQRSHKQGYFNKYLYLLQIEKNKDVGWKISMTWWVLFCLNYWRLFWAHHQKYRTLADNFKIQSYQRN